MLIASEKFLSVANLLNLALSERRDCELKWNLPWVLFLIHILMELLMTNILFNDVPNINTHFKVTFEKIGCFMKITLSST